MGLLLAKASKLRVFDGFNRANNALSIGNADTGQSWQLPSGGTFGIINSQGYNPVYNIANCIFINADIANVFVECKFTIIITYLGLLLRAINGDEHLRVSVDDSTPKKWTFSRRTGGITTVLATLANANNGDIVSVRTIDNNFQIYINDIDQGVVNSDFNAAVTNCGIYCGTSSGTDGVVRFDNFKVEAI